MVSAEFILNLVPLLLFSEAGRAEMAVKNV